LDPSGADLRNDDAAFAKAKVLAIGVSIDKAAVDTNPQSIRSGTLLF
jgi:hypothetical protein